MDNGCGDVPFMCICLLCGGGMLLILCVWGLTNCFFILSMVGYSFLAPFRLFSLKSIGMGFFMWGMERVTK